MANELSYAFFGDQPTGPGSYDALQSRRKIVEALAGKRSPYPKNVGEGLTSVGESIYDIAAQRDLDRRDAARTAALGKEATDAYRPTVAAGDEPTDETPPASAPIRTAALTPSTATDEPTAPNPVRDGITQAAMAGPRAGGRLGLDQSVEFGSGPVAPAGPVGNAPNMFGPSITNPATGATLNVPTQPPPNRFSTAFGPLPNVPNVVAQPNAPDFVPTTAPQRMAALTGGSASPTMTDIPSAPPGAAPAARINDAFSAIPSAPPAPTAAPTQTASQDAYQPIVPRVPTEEVRLNQPEPQRPRPTPQSLRELQALQRMAAFPGDPDVQRIWQPIAQAEAAKRAFADKIIDQEYQARLGRHATETAANQVEARARADKELERRLKEQDLPRLPQQGATPVVQTRFGPVDTRLGTEASPQRNGVPDADPVPPWAIPKEWAALQTKKQNAVIEANDKATPQFTQMIDLIQQANAHPGRHSAVGFFGKAASLVPGTEAYGYAQLLDQIKNKNFLTGYDSLRGAGAVSNIEGEKTAQAQARLSQAQNKEDFQKALNDFELNVRSDFDRIQRKAHVPVTAWQLGRDDRPAPDIGEIDATFSGGPRRYRGGNPRDPNSWQMLR